MKSHEFQCRDCEEIKSANHYVPSGNKVKKMLCAECKALEIEMTRQAFPANEPKHASSGNSPNPKASHSHIRTETIKAQNEIATHWEDFKKTYRTFDISIQFQTRFIEEIHLPTEITALDSDAVDTEVASLIERLNQLRSHRYHLLRNEAFLRRENFRKHLEAEQIRLAAEKKAKMRNEAVRKLRGAERRIYKMTGLLPKEFMTEFLAIARKANETEDPK